MVSVLCGFVCILLAIGLVSAIMFAVICAEEFGDFWEFVQEEDSKFE
jgi:hypothetical protein